MLTGRIKCSRGEVKFNGVTPLSTVQKIVGFVGTSVDRLLCSEFKLMHDLFFVLTGQEDIMYPMLTVRQVLVDSALSRLPQVWPMKKKLAIVDDVMVRRAANRLPTRN